MRHAPYSILLIVLVLAALIATSYHRHGDLASMAKCPSCSGKYVSANTHIHLAVPELVRHEAHPLEPPPLRLTLTPTPLPRSLNDRAPPCTAPHQNLST